MRISRFEFNQLHDFRQPLESLTFTELVEEMEQEVVVAPIVPSFSQEQLTAAVEQARKEGFAAGLDAGHAEAANEAVTRNVQTLQLLEQLQVMWKEHEHFYAQFVHQQCEHLHLFILTVARKIAGEAMKNYPELAIKELLFQCLPIIINKPRVTLEVHPDMIESLQAQMRPYLEQSGFEGGLHFRANPHYAMVDARIEWPSGKAERNITQLWQEIEAILAEIDFTQSQDINHTTS